MREEEKVRLKVLCEHYVVGTLTEGQLHELEERLLADEQARLVFLTYMEVHAGLGWEARTLGWGAVALPGDLAMAAAASVRSRPDTGPAHLRRGSLISRVPGIWWAGALTVMLCGLMVGWTGLRWSAVTNAPLATVKAERHASWNGGRELMVGTEVVRGLLDLQSGLVELETQSNVTLILEGPAQLQLHDALHATLHRGNLVVRMAKGESGFVVNTPQMKVTDLGTEFGVSATSEGISRVQVYEGKVRAEAGDAAGLELVAGQMISRRAGGALTPGTFEADRFIRRFPPRRPGVDEGGVLYNRSRLERVRVAAAPSGNGRGVKVDGRLDEWDHSVAFLSACEAPFAGTYHLKGLMMYDATHLYLAAHVGDPEPLRNAGVREGVEFAGGSVIVRLAADRGLGWPLKGSAEDVAVARRKGTVPLPDSISDRIANIIMWYDRRQKRARIRFAYGFDSHGTITPAEGWQGVFVKDPDGRGYTLEYAIPWSLLHTEADPPRAGDVMGALWMVHWSDADGVLCRGQLVDVTRPAFDSERSRRISPGSYFQFGRAWGRAEFLPPAPL